MKRIFLVLGFMLLFATSSLAGDFIPVDGNHYAKNGVLYDRVDKGYWAYSYGRWWWYPLYEYVPVKVSFDSTSFDRDVLKLVAARQRYRYNVELFEKAGLAEYVPGPYGRGYGGYGVASPVGAYGYSGNTQYGYTYNSIVDVYGHADVNAGLQASAALAKESLNLADGTNAKFNDNLKMLTQGMNAAMEINAKAQAIQALANAIRPEPRSTTTTNIQGTGVESGASVNTTAKALLRKETLTTCIGCHNQRDPKPQIDLTKYDTLPFDTQLEVLHRITSKNPEKQMPPPDKGKRLTASQIGSLLPDR